MKHKMITYVNYTANIPRFAAVFLFCFCCLFLPPASYSQDFSAVGRDLDQLEDLIAATLLNTEEQRKLSENLQKNLNESGSLIEDYGNIIIRQELLLADLQNQLKEMSEIYRKQSSLSAKYAQSSKFWRTFTLIAVPAAAALSGTLV